MKGIGKMIDLHLHTYYSDGTLSPEEIVERAKKRGLTTISITDHDGINGITEAIEAGKRYEINVIPGIELSANVNDLYAGANINVHILGYGIDIHNVELNKAIKAIRKQREERNDRLLKVLNSIGYSINKEELYQRPGQDYIGKPNFALAMVKKGYINSPKDAFKTGEFLNHPKAKEVRRKKITAKKAISLIHGAKGKAVLAHPFKISFLKKCKEDFYKGLEELLDSLQSWGLNGMECHYSSHTPEQISILEGIAKRRKLIITSGSDFHGPEFDPMLDIGVTKKV